MSVESLGRRVVLDQLELRGQLETPALQAHLELVVDKYVVKSTACCNTHNHTL